MGQYTVGETGDLFDPITGRWMGVLDRKGQEQVINGDAIQSLVSKDGTLTAITFGGAGTTSVPQASSVYTGGTISTTAEVTAGTGVTSLVAQVQVTNDAATASGSGSAWTTVGTITLTAPGTGKLPIALGYLGLRINVTTLVGGTASGGVRNQFTLTAGAGTTGQNPALTGVPVPGPYTALNCGVPIVFPPSGTVGANGALTGLGSGLPLVYNDGCWMYFPAGAAFSGSAAGLYWTVMSSATAGVIYNNTLPLGASPSVTPTVPTAVVAAGPGAYTGASAFVSAPLGITIPGGALGNNGAIEYYMQCWFNNSASVKTMAATLGNTQVGNITTTNQRVGAMRRRVRNQNNQAKQIFFPMQASTFTDSSLNGGAEPFNATVDTAQAQVFGFYPYVSTVATDYAVIHDLQVIIQPGA